MAYKQISLTHARLKELLEYDPSTGVFKWIAQRGRSKAGDVAGADHHSGYWRIRIDGILHNAHRLAWLYMTGAWPEHDIDHINNIKSDNRFANLRKATRSQNIANRAVPHPNPTGFKGVRFNGASYTASITVKRKARFLGAFDTPEEASAAFSRAAAEAFGEFARL